MQARFRFVPLLLLIIGGFAHSDQDAASYRIPLLDSSSLERWVRTGCEFALEDGVLTLTNGAGFVRAHHRLGDFVLELKWRARSPEARGAVCFRAPLPEPGSLYPERYRIQLQPGSAGHLTGTTATGNPDLVKPGEWNELRLSVAGATASLEINGQNVWTFDEFAESHGWLGLYVEETGGGSLEFRDVVVTELGFRSMFNGQIQCRGTSYRITHNGVDVVLADEQTAPELQERRLEGHLGLQNHSEEVWFRHVRIGPPD